MKIGYARVSTIDQNLNMQLDALKDAGCEQIYQEKVTGALRNRPELDAALEFLKEGDILIIWKLDRLGRSLKDLIDIVNLLQERKIELISLQENISTGQTTGKLIFHIFAALAEFERAIIRERCSAGLKAAKSRGKLSGRPKKLTDEQSQQLFLLYKENKFSIDDLAKMFGISNGTVFQVINRIRGDAPLNSIEVRNKKRAEAKKLLVKLASQINDADFEEKFKEVLGNFIPSGTL